MTEAVKKTQKSYFVQAVNRYYLDDGESFIEHKPLDEGLFQQYQDLTSKVKLDRTGENTELDIRPGIQRKFLLEKLITGWNMVDEAGKPITFDARKISQLPPNITQNLVDDIYKSNQVLSGIEPEDSSEEGKTQPK